MRPTDLPELERRLTDLADALGGRAPSKAALRVWLDTLAECTMPDVSSVLTDWPKSHAKPPLPAEVLKACRDRLSDRIERQAAVDREAGKTFSVDRLKGDPNSPAYRAFQAALAELKRKPKPGPKDWAWRLREKEIRGEFLYPVQRENWRAALRGMPGAEMPSESEADIEARLEREAIQAEAAE